MSLFGALGKIVKLPIAMTTDVARATFAPWTYEDRGPSTGKVLRSLIDELED